MTDAPASAPGSSFSGSGSGSRTPSSPWGPWLVGLGAALWGTESAWRIPLNDLFDPDVIVFWEHVILVLTFLPFALARFGELKTVSNRAMGFLVFSGIAGSAVGTIFFTLALKVGNPIVVNVIPNLQPVISTIGAVVLFHDRLARRFFLWAPLAIIAGIFLSVEHPELITTSFAQAGVNAGSLYAAICAIFWALSTVAGRGVMVEMDVRLASALRLCVGLICMTLILAAQGKLEPAALWPPAAEAHAAKAGLYLVLLSELSGGLPLLIYFKGLSMTRASTAGYFEMLQTFAGALVAWLVVRSATLTVSQLVAGLVLVFAVAMVQRAQASLESGESGAKVQV
jgi:drug/metabolite transporter (DMT)-like permease